MLFELYIIILILVQIAVVVLVERPRLADQPVDDVAVLDAMLAPAPGSR